MPAFLVAMSTSDDAAAGALFSLWFLLGLFIIVIAMLWVLYARPHQRVPPRAPRAAPARGASGATLAAGREPDLPATEEPGDR